MICYLKNLSTLLETDIPHEKVLSFLGYIHKNGFTPRLESLKTWESDVHERFMESLDDEQLELYEKAQDVRQQRLDYQKSTPGKAKDVIKALVNSLAEDKLEVVPDVPVWLELQKQTERVDLMVSDDAIRAIAIEKNKPEWLAIDHEEVERFALKHPDIFARYFGEYAFRTYTGWSRHIVRDGTIPALDEPMPVIFKAPSQDAFADIIDDVTAMGFEVRFITHAGAPVFEGNYAEILNALLVSEGSNDADSHI
jgi:hypothetical protein